ncbi:M48 family metallopeptidase [Oceanispirochaeta sp.]|uniref:M48 family metallopeptidase n=1 Tax=Oceanispirochaeta sp. TaxID=2035350 RepID=UPI0026220BE8|nr:M48 family metallopeptidase [Oceanispirochaeta sp.]MDA3956359.1 M48 family metallopeptidase [Oceanispirochaeta sp.]
MSSSLILILVISLFVIEFLVSWFLSILNLNSTIKNRSEVPKAFQETINQEGYDKSVSYTLVQGRFALLSAAWSFLFLLIIVLTGFPGKLETFMLNILPGGTLFSILYILVFSFIYSLSSIPFSLYSQFVIEEEFGFNKTTLSLFLTDMIKQMALIPVLAVPLLWGLFFFMDKSGSFWWIYASAFIIVFQLFILLLYPVLIAPLFNKFTALEDGSLKTRLQGLAERCGFGTTGIYVMDGSRRSGHSNAYFTGLGKFKRIVLFDTLIESLSEEELEAVLAHEIGHNKLKHIPKRLVVSIISLTGTLFVTSLCLNWDALFQAFTFAEGGYHSILIILMFCSTPFSFFLSPLSHFWSRKHEYEADAYACRAVSNNSALAQALLMLSRENLSNLTPHKLYSTFHYSHPVLSERLAAIEKADTHSL